MSKDTLKYFKTRDLRRDDWKRLLKKEVLIEEVSNPYFNGKVAFINILKVTSPLEVESPVGKVKIVDTNYKQLLFAPRDQNWWLTVMYDDKNHIIESYFDITKENNFEKEDNPFFYDMKLDVCIPVNQDPQIMDEEELKEILDKGLITQQEYKMAYEVANEIIKNYTNNKEKYYNYMETYFNKFIGGLK